MKYKLLLVSVMIACLFSGCGSKQSDTGFNQQTNEELAANSENENEITQDNLVEEIETQIQQQSDQHDQDEKNINSDTIDFTPSDDMIMTQGHSESYEVPEQENGTNGDSTVGTPSDSDDDTSVTPTKTPDEMIETYPTKEPDSVLPTPTKVPNTEEKPTPTKIPVITVIPTSTPTKVPTPRPTKTPTKAPTPTPTKAPTPTKVPTPAPTSTPSQTEDVSLSVRGVTISLGESKSSVVSKLGSPARTDATEYTYSFMVYNDNYKKFVMVAVENDKVVGWYTDATDFSYQGLTTSSSVSSINNTFNKSFSTKKTLSVTKDGVKSVFFMDMLGDNTIDGILVTKGASTDGVTSSVLTAWEKEVFDLTNSFRARNNLSALNWSAQAATAARLHSQDMADNNYFDHTGLNGSTPSSRMKAQGISFTMAGENIIGGYGNALYSSNGWMNSSGHRSNMLNSSYNHLGVGYVLGGSYGNYATQNFFKSK